MNDRDRLEQLRALRDRLERLPASRQRDQILRDVRCRTVGIESGMRRTTVPPLGGSSLEPLNATRRPRRTVPSSAVVGKRPRATAEPKTSASSGSSIAGRAAAIVPAAAPLREGVLLFLDEDVIATESAGRGPVAPWARGLRG